MKTNSSRRILAFLGFVLGFYILAVILQPIIFANRFGSFTTIAGVDVSYRSRETAKSRLEQAFSDYSKGNIVVGDNTVVAGEYITSFKTNETIDQALLAEQQGYFAFSKIRGQKHALRLEYNNEAISGLLLSAYETLSIQPVDASIQINGTTTIIPEIYGQHLLFVESKLNIIEGLTKMAKSIDFKVVSQAPALTRAEAEAVIKDAEANVSEPITLLGDGENYQIQPTDLRRWLKISSATPKSLVVVEDFVPHASDYYYLDQSKVFLYVDNLASRIDLPAVNAELGVESGSVVITVKERAGRTVDRVDAINQIQQAVTGDRVASLKITTVKPEIRSDNLAELGLVELVATGWTDFSGSPANRIHNIRTGASKFDGVLIKPDEDFSFNGALGPVEANTGYLPELVILANKTVPEFGGGLCQVSSTAFRAALNAGLPILERHAHAYPVSYYKPYGVDATIYLPTPDLRFANDTGKYILIQTRIEGKRLYFDFYGTKKAGSITFSGNDKAIGAVFPVEKVTPILYDQGIRGNNSFTAVVYRHIYDATGELTDNDKFTSKYDSPDKYPH